MIENTRQRDSLTIAMERGRAMAHDTGMHGWGVVQVHAADGSLKAEVPFTNLITTAGDEYYARMAVAGVGTPNAAAPTEVYGMKLGTGTVDVAKSGSGAYLATGHITGSTNALDSSYPQVAAVSGTDAGWYAIYRVAWAAGDATNSAITHAVICTDSDDDGGTAAETIAVAEFTAVDKAAGDSLTITWQHKFLGA